MMEASFESYYAVYLYIGENLEWIEKTMGCGFWTWCVHVHLVDLRGSPWSTIWYKLSPFCGSAENIAPPESHANHFQVVLGLPLVASRAGTLQDEKEKQRLREAMRRGWR
jgi:hypothetical protein